MNFLSLKNRSLAAQSLFFAAHISITSLTFTADFFTGPLTTVSSLGYGKDIFLVKDADNKQFILKYNTKNNCLVSNPEPSIHEALGAKIGMTANININDVKLIPAYDKSIQSVDINPEIPKTLHTLVPGKEVCNAKMPYNVNIQLSRDNAPHNLISLTYHKHLCHIAALDMFTSNWDRHNGNLFFDELTNQFYAIDMDWIFSQIYQLSNETKVDEPVHSFINFIQPFQKKSFHCNLLATQMYQVLQKVDPKTLTAQEIEALKEVNDMLEKLQSIYSPKKLFNEWMNIAEQAHYVYSQHKQQHIRYLIAYNYLEISKVRSEINRIISNNRIVSYMQYIKDHAIIAWQNTKLQSGIVF